ncbi:MAG: carbohydrate ABC transporter permease [Clostridiales bacterium]|nr:carbohydrate ABC transporter permease [Clostridiales bacterium]
MKSCKRYVSGFFLHTTLFVLLILLLYPLAMALWGAFKSPTNFTETQWYPTLPLYFSNFWYALEKLVRPILNTLLVAILGTAGVLFISSLSAYAYARMKFPGQNFLYMFVMALMMVPGCLTLVPSYMLYKGTIGIDNYAIMILPMWVGAPVSGVFLLRGFFAGLPEGIFEAARIDGAKEFFIYTRICLPLSLPILGTMTIMQFSNVWNDYFWPMITIKNENLLTVSASLLLKYAASTQPAMYAGYLVASLLLVFLFLFANRYYVEGLASTALKL